MQKQQPANLLNEVTRKRLFAELPFYADNCLSIRTKEGKIESLRLNKVQRYIDQELNKQREATGKVRALILKGRQQGCSTYVAARHYHQVVHRVGVLAYILTHMQEATDNLFSMIARYYEYTPREIRPLANAQNAKELLFEKINSGYKVGTAGSKSVGRGATIQLFHGSEVAFWPNDEEHLTGILQAVPDTRGTEIIFESTANGIGNMFYRMCMDAQAGHSEYKLIFVPWHWDEHYQMKSDRDFEYNPDDADLQYQRIYNLTDDQMRWRAKKIKELGSVYRFQQEYPANPSEAFQISSEDSFIPAGIVLEARRKKELPNIPYKCIMGIDPARYGDDDTAIVIRRGRKMETAELYHHYSTMEVVGIVTHAINRYEPDVVAIDVGGLGAGIYDRLKELGYENIYPINFGAKAIEEHKYSNKRAEIWALMKEWLADAPVQIVNNERLHGELIAPKYSYDSNGRLKIEKKDDIKKRGLKSPDVADALALTFAVKLIETLSKDRIQREQYIYDQTFNSERDEVSGY